MVSLYGVVIRRHALVLWLAFTAVEVGTLVGGWQLVEAQHPVWSILVLTIGLLAQNLLMLVTSKIADGLAHC